MHYRSKLQCLTCSVLGRVCGARKVSSPLMRISSASAGGNGGGKTTTSLFIVSETKTHRRPVVVGFREKDQLPSDVADHWSAVPAETDVCL